MLAAFVFMALLMSALGAEGGSGLEGKERLFTAHVHD